MIWYDQLIFIFLESLFQVAKVMFSRINVGLRDFSGEAFLERLFWRGFSGEAFLEAFLERLFWRDFSGEAFLERLFCRGFSAEALLQRLFAEAFWQKYFSAKIQRLLLLD